MTAVAHREAIALLEGRREQLINGKCDNEEKLHWYERQIKSQQAEIDSIEIALQALGWKAPANG